MRRARFTRPSKTVGEALHLLKAMVRRRPTLEIQSEAADCGYVCVSAVMTLLGSPMPVHEVKEAIGTTARGLKLKQLRDGLRKCGVEADAIFFDRARPGAFPCSGIALLAHGHYVVIASRNGDRFEIFDPQFGWSWTTARKLGRRCSGFGVQVNGLSASARTERIGRHREPPSLPLRTLIQGRTARTALGIFALAQLVTLALPLLTAWSVDRSTSVASLGLLGAIAIGFAALSVTNVLVSLFAEMLQSRTKRIATVALGRGVFDSLAGKSPYWFELNGTASLQNRIGSLNAILDFQIDVLRAVGSLVVTVAVGLAALLFISPLLLIPGLVSLLLSIMLDLLFEQSERSHFASSVETSQRRQAFVLDTLCQLPLIARFGALAPARTRFTSLVRSAATVETRLQSLRDTRGSLAMLLKSGEALVFVTLSAAFMAAGDFTIGAFVALGAYKDLLAGAISSVFQLGIRSRSLQVHRLQAAALLTSERWGDGSVRDIAHGEVRFEEVSFRYGSLDRPVLDQVNFHARPGECTVIRGPSGSGKSTIAKLLVKALAPSQGAITIDGQPLADKMDGMAAVLQTDRLIAGTIRENVTMLRRNVSDSDIFAALKTASVDDFVADLPMGLNTFIGEGVAGLSGGQRQRLLIARAVLGLPRLLILDEATSSLDVHMEADILRALRSNGATTILIAHRPEVWALANRVYTFDEAGKLKDGTDHPAYEVAS